MSTGELLSDLLKLFQEGIAGVDFSRAHPGKAGSRRIVRPAVTGEVGEETLKPGSEEVKYRFRIFLPEGQGAEKAEEIFGQMCTAAGRAYPGFSAISRGVSGRDAVTGLLTVECTLTFLTVTGGGKPSAAGKKVMLGGQEYQAAAVKTTMSFSGEELISIGETEPFAVKDAQVCCTVEMTGIDVSGLDRLAAFTARIGENPGTVYRNCRWKSLSDALGKAVFVSRDKAEEN